MVDSFQKRERNRRQIQKRQEKADRRRHRAETKVAPPDEPLASRAPGEPAPADASEKPTSPREPIR